ncbi:MAG: GNAT family N-acetyltransferase [Pseudomonadota bacterium]
MTAFAIRTLRASDVAAMIPLNAQVQKLHAEALPHRFHANPDDAEVQARFRNWLQTEGVTVFGATAGDRLIGYAVFEIIETQDKLFTKGERFGFLHHIVVDTRHRRKGIGLSLIERGKQSLRETGIQRLEASYWAFNGASRHLMARAGLCPSEIFVEGRL